MFLIWGNPFLGSFLFFLVVKFKTMTQKFFFKQKGKKRGFYQEIQWRYFRGENFLWYFKFFKGLVFNIDGCFYHRVRTKVFKKIEKSNTNGALATKGGDPTRKNWRCWAGEKNFFLVHVDFSGKIQDLIRPTKAPKKFLVRGFGAWNCGPKFSDVPFLLTSGMCFSPL